MPALTPVEGSCASASLVAYVMDRKYCMGLPIYRISQDLASTAGLTVTRQAMADWVIKAYERWLSLVYSLMRERLMELSVMHIDEMPNMADPSDREALSRLLPWSEAVSESCRMTPAETTSPDPMGVPVIDVDPHTLDEE